MDAALRRYVEQCPDAVLVTDPAGRIVHANAEFQRMSGYALDELVGSDVALFGLIPAAYGVATLISLLVDSRKDGGARRSPPSP